MHASSAYVGLAAPGEVGSWQTEAKVTSTQTSKSLLELVDAMTHVT